MRDAPTPAADYAVRPADLSRAEDRAALVALLDGYARDPMGGGRGLDAAVLCALPDRLAAQPGARVFLAHTRAGEPVGLAVCFLGFSTFAARPLLNLHDLAVAPCHRGKGIGRRLLAAVEDAARAAGCCKVTLEVRVDNPTAQKLYRALGYGDVAAPHHFWSKAV